jgi:hypothetical protein
VKRDRDFACASKLVVQFLVEILDYFFDENMFGYGVSRRMVRTPSDLTNRGGQTAVDG